MGKGGQVWMGQADLVGMGIGQVSCYHFKIDHFTMALMPCSDIEPKLLN